MKNLFKFGFLALAISLSVAACNTDKSAEGTDTTSTVVEADTTLSVDTTGAASDTTIAVDTTATN